MKMKPALFILVIFSLTTSLYAAADPNFYVYLCFGQSNMDGAGRIEDQDKTVDQRFQVLATLDNPGMNRTKGHWYPAVPPLCRPTGGLGPADYFGRTMVAALPRGIRVGVINVAVPGCKIELFEKDTFKSYAATAPGWMTGFINGYDGNPYQYLVDMAKLAQKDGVIKGILLHQGESNANDRQWPAKVKGIYDDLIRDLNLKAEDVPLLAGETVNADQQGVCAGMNRIIAELPNTLRNSYVISSAGCTCKVDHLHFNSAGYREFGKRYAEKMLSLMAPDSEAETRALGFSTPIKWKSSGVLVSPISDETHQIVSVKDPTIVRCDGLWHVYATVYSNSARTWSMVYLNFKDFADAPKAKLHYIDINPGLRGYHCAPCLFYFRPHMLWYLVFQSQQPQYCVTDDITRPEAWTAPQNFFDRMPAGAPRLPIDYHIICDNKYAYLFFTGDNGCFYRSRTRIEDFPKGMGDIEVAIQDDRNNLFEGSMTYKIKGTDTYLTMIEALSPARHYRAWISRDLNGSWTPLPGADSWETPFAGINNVTFEDGVTPWTRDISHGELIRDGYNETPTIDPENLRFLYQGRDPAINTRYDQLPYRLGLLTLVRSAIAENAATREAASTSTATQAAATRPDVKLPMRVNCGSFTAFKDSAGNVWAADQQLDAGKAWGADDGSVVNREGIGVTGVDQPHIYETERYRMGSYKFKVPEGKYTVRLHFAETFEGITGPGMRVFSVSVAGRQVLKDLDLFKEVGPRKAFVKEYKGVSADNGELVISFTPNIENPQICGIEILAE